MPGQQQNHGIDFLLTDQVGTLRAVADTSGAIVKRIDYDSFGNILSDSNPAFTVPFGFAGGLHDRDTGLVRFGYRDYSPELGRWTAKDPLDFGGGDTNLYGYVMNDPIDLTDRWGLLSDHNFPFPTIDPGSGGGGCYQNITSDDFIHPIQEMVSRDDEFNRRTQDLSAALLVPVAGALVGTSGAVEALAATGAALESAGGHVNRAIERATEAISPYAAGIMKFAGDVADGVMPGSPSKYNYTTTITNLGYWNYDYYGAKK